MAALHSGQQRKQIFSTSQPLAVADLVRERGENMVSKLYTVLFFLILVIKVSGRVV